MQARKYLGNKALMGKAASLGDIQAAKCVRCRKRDRKPDAQRCATCTAKAAEDMWRSRQGKKAAPHGPVPVQRTMNLETDGLITEHMRMAKAIAWKAKGRIPSSSSVDVDDMVGDAMLGLVVAGRTFDEERRVPFGAWAATRIRGAVWDGIRRWNGTGKSRPIMVEWHGDDAA